MPLSRLTPYLAALISLVLPELASAQSSGVALRWERCYGEGSGQSVRSFACNTNSGVEEVVVSFAVPEYLPEVSGMEINFQLHTYDSASPHWPQNSPPVPAWWQFVSLGTCRRTSLSFSLWSSHEDQVCQSLWHGAAQGAIAGYQISPWDAGIARIYLIAAVPIDALIEASAGVEYHAFTLYMRHDKTVGAGACDGCLAPMWLSVNSILLTTLGNTNNQLLTMGLGPYANVALWSPVPVPTRRSSWAAVKSLYR